MSVASATEGDQHRCNPGSIPCVWSKEQPQSPKFLVQYGDRMKNLGGQGREEERSRTLAFLSTLPLLAGRMEGLLFLSSAALLTGTKCSGGLPLGLFVASCGKERE